MEMALGFSGFADLSEHELLAVDGGINWDRVFAGTSVYLGATLAVAMATTPIGWAAGATYVAICAASGAYVGYGLGS